MRCAFFLVLLTRTISYRFVSFRIDRRVCVGLFYISLATPLTHALGHEGILILFIAVWITAIERVHRSIIGVRDGERIVTFLPASARARVMDAVRVDPLRPAFRRTRRWARRRGAFGARVQRRRLLFIREKHVCDGWKIRRIEVSRERDRSTVASRRVASRSDDVSPVPTRAKCREFVKYPIAVHEPSFRGRVVFSKRKFLFCVDPNQTPISHPSAVRRDHTASSS